MVRPTEERRAPELQPRERGRYACVNTCQVCAVIAVWFCFCLAMGMDSSQLLFWKSFLNCRCSEVYWAEGLRLRIGAGAHVLWSFRFG